MTIRHYLAGGVILVAVAVGGYWFGLREDCENRPHAGCLLNEAEAALAGEEQSFAIAGLHVELALARANRGEDARAGVLYKAAEEIAQGFGNTRMQGMAWVTMGAMAIRGGDLDHGRAFFARANRAAWDSGEKTALQVNETRNILIAQAAAGDLDGAVGGVAALRTGLWRAQTLLALAGGLADGGQSARLSTVMARAMAELDAIEDTQVKMVLMPMLAGIQAAAGDIEAARITANGIEDIVHQAMAWRQIAEAQAGAGDLDGAIASFANIKHFRERDWALWPIAAAQARAGDFASAEESAGRINDPMARDQAMGDIAAQYAAAGQLDRARAIVEKLEEGFLRGRARRMIVEELVKARDYDRAIEVAGKIERDRMREMMLANVAVAQAETGGIGAARATLDLIETPGETPGARGYALSKIAAAEAGAGETAQAVATARAIENAQWRATALHKLALAMKAE